MKRIEAIIRKTKFEEVKEALLNSDIDWFEYHNVHGMVKPTVKVILEVAHTGEVGDGRIFVSEMIDTWSIRTGENGDTVLRDKK